MLLTFEDPPANVKVIDLFLRRSSRVISRHIMFRVIIQFLRLHAILMLKPFQWHQFPATLVVAILQMEQRFMG